MGPTDVFFAVSLNIFCEGKLPILHFGKIQSFYPFRKKNKVKKEA